MKTLSLYNNDGTLSTEAQFLISPKPQDMTLKERRKSYKEFKSQFSEKDWKELIRLRDRAQGKMYHIQNKEKRSNYSKSYHIKNKEKINAYSKSYYFKNKKSSNASNRTYCYRNKEEKKAYTAEYQRTRRHKDPLYNFFHSIRSQAVRVVKQVGLGKKPTNTFKWVGCSPEQLKVHIESLFQEGMTWDNYGKRGWHVDHIRPVSSFKPEEWEQINHYTNLQPLWWYDNLKKGDRHLSSCKQEVEQ